MTQRTDILLRIPPSEQRSAILLLLFPTLFPKQKTINIETDTGVVENVSIQTGQTRRGRPG